MPSDALQQNPNARARAAPLTGRMAAWGQTKAQMLHWVQASAFHVGTASAMERFSMAVVPGGNMPPGVNTLGARERGRAGRRAGERASSVGLRHGVLLTCVSLFHTPFPFHTPKLRTRAAPPT